MVQCLKNVNNILIFNHLFFIMYLKTFLSGCAETHRKNLGETIGRLVEATHEKFSREQIFQHLVKLSNS